jgi:arylsulfatase A-like enzyme
MHAAIGRSGSAQGVTGMPLGGDAASIPRRAGTTAALLAARSWAIYWIVECVCIVVWPWFRYPAYDYQRPDPAFTLLLVPIYICGGFIAGAILGRLLIIVRKRSNRNYSPEALSALGTLTVVLAFAAKDILHGILHGRAGGQDALSLAVCVLLAAVLLKVCFGRPQGRLHWLTNAWNVSIVLIGTPWVVSQLDGTTWGQAAKFLMVAALVAVVESTAWLLDRVVHRSAPDFTSIRRASLLGLPILALIGLNLVLKQMPMRTPAPAAAYLAGNHPNILLLTLDTVRADHLSIDGYQRNTTPNLEKFAQVSTLYTNAISASDMTLSSHASLFTGLYPSRNGAHLVTGRSADADLGAALPPSVPTIAQILSNNGYRTVGVVANLFYLKDNYGLNRGFQYYSEAYPDLFLATTPQAFYIRDGVCAMLRHLTRPAAYERAYRRAGKINAEALSQLKQAKAGGRPFFLFLNYMDAHEVYFPPAPFDTRYPGGDPRLEATEFLKAFDDVLALKRPYSERERRRDISQYDGGIAYLDIEFAKLLSGLKSLGLYDNTIIIVTSDHGQAFGERNLVGHGTSVYQDQVHVPLLIHLPAQRDGQIVRRIVNGVDVMPTLLALAHLPVPANLDGRNLYASAQDPSEVMLSESYPDDHRVALSPRFKRIERAIFEGTYKFIGSTSGQRELYDLSSDPAETHNLYTTDNRMAQQMEAKLESWVRIEAKRAAHTVKIDSSARERLRSLGYVQ